VPSQWLPLGSQGAWSPKLSLTSPSPIEELVDGPKALSFRDMVIGHPMEQEPFFTRLDLSNAFHSSITSPEARAKQQEKGKKVEVQSTKGTTSANP